MQLAKRLALRVFAVASRSDGVALVDRLGADRVAEGHSKSLVRELQDFAPDGLAGALVFTGARGWKQELALVVRGGTVTWPDGVEPVPSIPRGVHRKSYDGEPSTRAFAQLNELVAREPFHVELSKVYPLDATSQALRDVQHHHVGKLAIRIDHA